jgi:hypothetical protein
MTVIIGGQEKSLMGKLLGGETREHSLNPWLWKSSENVFHSCLDSIH